MQTTNDKYSLNLFNLLCLRNREYTVDQFLRGTRNSTSTDEGNFICNKRRVQWKNIKTVKEANISSFKEATIRSKKKEGSSCHPSDLKAITVYNRKHKMPCINTKGERRELKTYAVSRKVREQYSCDNPKKRESRWKTFFLLSESRNTTFNWKSVKRPLY